MLSVGTLSENKRPEMLLDVAQHVREDAYSFVLVGAGELEERLRMWVRKEGLRNVHLPGNVTETLPFYYRAADVLMVPGRGGIVISEAMAFGLPVVLHEADGTEYGLGGEPGDGRAGGWRQCRGLSRCTGNAPGRSGERCRDGSGEQARGGAPL